MISAAIGVRGDREAPAGRVCAATVELMEHRPHLADQRGDAARELFLQRQSEGRGPRPRRGNPSRRRACRPRCPARGRRSSRGCRRRACARRPRADRRRTRARPSTGNEIEHNRYVTTTAITATSVFSWLRGRLPVLSHRGGEDPRDRRLRGRRRHGHQRRLPARAVPRAGRAAEARREAVGPRRRAPRREAAAGGSAGRPPGSASATTSGSS